MHNVSKMNPKVSKSYINISGVTLSPATAIDGSMNSFFSDFLIYCFERILGAHAGTLSMTNRFFKTEIYE